MKVKKYLRGEGANLEGLRDKKLKGQLAIREELYGKSAKAAAKAEKIFLWIKLLQTWLLPIVSLPIQTTCFVASSIFSFNSDTQDVDMTKDSSFNCGFDSHTEDVEMDVSLPSVCISDSTIMG
ncbi:uncharacterized protein LOC114264033 isoform X3 [Camellia sinensis]|nr:uncharacterized protein LOC114264033 isoform X2 [Camellia sinensis]XP_028060426.1 uncharacterized protein LOC114264033 isoform X2 [Camellia sinensis]XP_028060427.1 uncharacterized protein LOC114264033 isoform X2 [Camellia sinensis]XP_028060428.1 uncharacterized protein LOC114264033 isoform X2 [Camellia sinensis]XP_028060429.1 uncharacterized protein LOC114264033 isoform X3 [Camellia sinensis]